MSNSRSGNNAISPSAAASIGISKGNHAESGTVHRPADPLVTGTVKSSVPLGNAKALDVGRGGPGAGYVVHRNGTQGHHGSAAGSVQPQGRDILSDFSPTEGDW